MDPRLKYDDSEDGTMALIKLWQEFAEFNKDSKQIEADVHRKCIFGSHAAAYMTTLMEDSESINEKSLHDFPKCLGNIPAIELSWVSLREWLCSTLSWLPKLNHFGISEEETTKAQGRNYSPRASRNADYAWWFWDLQSERLH